MINYNLITMHEEVNKLSGSELPPFGMSFPYVLHYIIRLLVITDENADSRQR